MTALNLLSSVLAYDDDISSTINNNPYKRIPDWSTQIYGLTIKNPQAKKYTIEPSSSITLFDGTRLLSIDGTSVFSLTFISGSVYRLQCTSGTQPLFRIPRSISSDATSLFTISINNNSVVTLLNSGGTIVDFSTVQIGDTLYISNSSPFNVLNEGYFKIISKTSNSISIQNPSAAAENNIPLGVNYATDFQIFSSGPVVAGDTIILYSGFSLVSLGSYTISSVTPSFVEFISTNPLPNESNIVPTASGIIIYSDAKFVTYIECDQNSILKLNADVGNNVLIEPAIPKLNAQSGVNGIFTKIGTSYKGVLKNNSINNCSAFVFTAEKA